MPFVVSWFGFELALHQCGDPNLFLLLQLLLGSCREGQCFVPRYGFALIARDIIHGKKSPVYQVGPTNATHPGIIALNLALVTLMFGFDLRHTFATSDPMCSPSLSQSVQIISSSALRASASRFLSIPCMLLSWMKD
jgi:hypothetical protein